MQRRDDPLARKPVNREYDSYRRGAGLAPSQQAYGEESNGPSFTDYRRRPPVPARARQPAYDEDINEVFEEQAVTSAAMTRFLHVANGTSTTRTIEAARIPGVCSIWADPLYDGPVPGGR